MLKMKKWKIVALLLISILSISMIVYKKNLDLQKMNIKLNGKRMTQDQSKNYTI